MDKKPNKRMRVQIAILCVIVSVFVITGIVYAITIKQYVLDGGNVPDDTYYASSETQPESEMIPETEQATPSPVVTEEPAPTKIPEPSFRQQNEDKYSDEIKTSYQTYLSDTTYVAVTKASVNDSPYCLAHVIVKDPSQIINIITTGRRLSTAPYEENNAVLVMSASGLKDYTHFLDGLHISDYAVVGSTTDLTGTELAFDKSGNLYRLNPTEKPDISEIQWTVLCNTPVLIENGKATDISDDVPTNYTCKSAIGMVTPGEYYFMVVSDGDYINEVTYKDMQKILMDKSCTMAQSLTTGVNVSMALQGELINMPAVGSGRPQYEYLIVKD